MGASTEALKDSKSKDCVIDPGVGIQFIDRKDFRSVDFGLRLRGPLRATLLVLLPGLQDGGTHILIGLNLDAEADDLMLTNENVI